MLLIMCERNCFHLSLKLWAVTKIIPTRGVTITKMLQMATGYTGRTYKRSEAVIAANDVKKWADEMKAAIPKVER